MMGYGMWIEALATCAIGGNQYAIQMLKLRDTDRRAFIRELMKLTESGEPIASRGGLDGRA